MTKNKAKKKIGKTHPVESNIIITHFPINWRKRHNGVKTLIKQGQKMIKKYTHTNKQGQKIIKKGMIKKGSKDDKKKGSI